VPQGFLSLNVENGITIILMAFLFYLITAFLFQLLGRGVAGLGGGSGGGGASNAAAPSLSFATNFNLAA
jgi:hypothetical protein